MVVAIDHGGIPLFAPPERNHTMGSIRSLLLLALFALAAVSPFHAAAAAPAKPIMSYVFFDGAEYRSEGDEYAVIKNAGGTAI